MELIMRKIVFIGILFFILCIDNIAIAYNSALHQDNGLNLKNDINISRTILDDLAKDPSSIQLRNLYLLQLNKIANDFNNLSKNESALYSKNNINYLALVFMGLFNNQHKKGLDIQNNFGSSLFTDINNINLIYDRVAASPYNRGTEDISVNIENTHQLTKSKYKLDFDTSTTYILRRQSDGQVINAGSVTGRPQSINADGFKIKINKGNIVAKDSFIISPLNNAAESIKITISKPQLLALAWPIVATGSNNVGWSTINVFEVTDINNKSFSVSHKLTPPLEIIFTSPTTYELFNRNTGEVIEGPITYDKSYSYIFPTPGGYDPGYRVALTGNSEPGDRFNIDFNLQSSNDHRNGDALRNLYSLLPSY